MFYSSSCESAGEDIEKVAVSHACSLTSWQQFWVHGDVRAILLIGLEGTKRSSALVSRGFA
jgi:hypothetical protein